MMFLRKITEKVIVNTKNMSLPVKASVAYMMINFLQKGISFLTAPIFTRLLTTAEFGKISIYSSWVEIFGIFAMFSLYYSVYNNGILEFKDDRENFTFSLLMLSNFLTILVFIAVYLVNSYIFHFLQLSNLLLCFMFIGFIFEPAFEFWKTQQRFEYRYKAVCLFSGLVMLGSPILGISGIYLFPDARVEARIIGGQIVILLIGVCSYFWEIHQSDKRVNLNYWKYGFFFNLPMLPYALSTYILNCSDRLMISYMVGDDAAGIYSIAYTMAAVVGIVWSSINAALTPTMYKRCYNHQVDTLSELVIPLVVCYGIVCIAIMGLAPEVIRFLAPASYGKGMYAIPAIVSGTFFNYTFSIFVNIIYFFHKQKYIMVAGMASALINFILNLLFIPQFGYLAAGYTTLLAYMLQYFGVFFLMKRVVGDSVYERKKIFKISALVVTSAMIFPLLYQWIILRYLVLLFTAFLIWKRSNIIIEIIKRDML